MSLLVQTYSGDLAAVPVDAHMLRDLASALIGSRVCSASLALASGSQLDLAGVVCPLHIDAAHIATTLANTPLPVIEDGPDAVWDRLGQAVLRAKALSREGHLIAGAMAWRGRGRIVGPLNGDLLLRFGVSMWR